MASNNNGNIVSSIDGLQRQMTAAVQHLTQCLHLYSGFICTSSEHELDRAIGTLNGIVRREVALHPRSDTYNLQDISISDSRDQHNSELVRSMGELSKTLTNGAIPEQYQNSILPDEPHVAYPEPDPLFPGRDQDSVDSGSPSGGEASVTHSNSSVQRAGPGSGSGPYFCTHEGCPVAASEKPFRFLSKLKDHERSHLPASFPCQECNQKFKQQRILRKHQARAHGPPKNSHTARVVHRPQVTNGAFTTDQDMMAPTGIAFQLYALQNQSYQLHSDAHVEDLFYDSSPPGLEIDTELDMDFQDLSFTSPEAMMSASDFGVLVDEASLSGSQDYCMGESEHSYS